MKKTLVLLVVIAIVFFANCRRKKEEQYSYLNVPQGGTAVISNQNLEGKGLITNTYGTTWLIKDKVVVDDMSVVGNVVVEPGAELIVNGLANVAGGAKFKVMGKVSCKDYTQVGDAYFTGAKFKSTGQFTQAGGTQLFLENSVFAVNDLRILGTIQQLNNEVNNNGMIYSVFYFDQANKYLNRAGGTQVCGNVLFTYNGDQGASGMQMNEVTNIVKDVKSSIYTNYGISSDQLFYKYTDSCIPVSLATGF